MHCVLRYGGRSACDSLALNWTKNNVTNYLTVEDPFRLMFSIVQETRDQIKIGSLFSRSGGEGRDSWNEVVH